MQAPEIMMAMLGTPGGMANPYPHYAQLHELGEVLVLQPGVFAVVGYDAVSSVLRDPAVRSRDLTELDGMAPQWRQHASLLQATDWMLNLNPPDHTRVRSLIARTFTARRVAALEPAIARMTDELLGAMADSGSGGSPVDFMQDFAYLLPVTVICELIGVPESDRESFRPIARDIAGVFEFSDFSSLGPADTAAEQLRDYFAGLAAQRRAEPRDDLLTGLVQIADAADGRLSDTELLHNLTLLLVAGFETTTNLLGNGLQVILADPRIGDTVRAGGVPVPAFVEEVLRYDSPVQAATNRVGYSTTVAGVQLAPGDYLMPLIGAGNRDPRKFTDPDIFDPGRAGAAPLSFGGGAHFCIGAALARLEAGVAFPRLLARFPALSPGGEPSRRSGLVLRGYDKLPVLTS